jgi:hypothetical protein
MTAQHVSDFLIVAALVLFALAVICIGVPTSIVSQGWHLWICSGLLAWAIEKAIERRRTV